MEKHRHPNGGPPLAGATQPSSGQTGAPAAGGRSPTGAAPRIPVRRSRAPSPSPVGMEPGLVGGPTADRQATSTPVSKPSRSISNGFHWNEVDRGSKVYKTRFSEGFFFKPTVSNRLEFSPPRFGIDLHRFDFCYGSAFLVIFFLALPPRGAPHQMPRSAK